LPAVHAGNAGDTNSPVITVLAVWFVGAVVTWLASVTWLTVNAVFTRNTGNTVATFTAASARVTWTALDTRWAGDDIAMTRASLVFVAHIIALKVFLDAGKTVDFPAVFGLFTAVAVAVHVGHRGFIGRAGDLQRHVAVGLGLGEGAHWLRHDGGEAFRAVGGVRRPERGN
jgi:hypothetical protein